METVLVYGHQIQKVRKVELMNNLGLGSISQHNKSDNVTLMGTHKQEIQNQLQQ